MALVSFYGFSPDLFTNPAGTAAVAVSFDENG